MASFQHDAPTTPLRQRMQEDMVMRGLGSQTQQDYIRHVRRFAAFLGRTPDTATVEDIRHLQLYQHENGVGSATINSTVSALRFLFTVTLKRRDGSARVLPLASGSPSVRLISCRLDTSTSSSHCQPRSP